MARTTYLGRMRPLDLMRTALGVPPGFWWSDVRREGRGLLKDIGVAATAARALIGACRARGIGHVHVHSCGRAALIAALAGRMGNVPYSLTLHGPLEDYGPGQRLKWRHAAFTSIITRKLLAEAQRDLAGDLPPRLPVQGMGVDTARLRREGPYRPVQPGETLRLFSCGRLNPVKGHLETMEAVARLKADGRAVRLEIAGEDDAGGSGFRSVLEAKIAALGLANEVTLLGAIGADEVRAKLLAAHIFVLASHAEPLGVAYMEAMSCATPTLGTNAGGVPELITNGVDGVLVPPRDVPALAQAIAALADAPERAVDLAAAGRTRIEAGFGAERGAEMLVEEVRRAHALT